jgi:RNA polymerase sigma factor (sigma-70 family)
VHQVKPQTHAYENATIETDQALIQRIRKGDENVLLEIYRNNINMVIKFVTDNSGYPEDGEDMLQDAVVVLWENAHKPDFDLTSKISTYLYSVVRNKWLRELTKRKAGKIANIDDYEIPEETIDVLKKIIHREEYKVILQCLELLGNTCRKILTMFYLEERGMEEIAHLMSFNSSDVAKAKKWQCKKELEQLVKRKFKK